VLFSGFKPRLLPPFTVFRQASWDVLTIRPFLFLSIVGRRNLRRFPVGVGFVFLFPFLHQPVVG